MPIVTAAGLLVSAVAETGLEIARGDHVESPRPGAAGSHGCGDHPHAVRRVAHGKGLEAEPFFIAAIGRMFVITAESTTHISLEDSTFQAALAELGVVAGITLAPAGAMRLLHGTRDEARQ